jgi:preprotein translocase subunit SecY
VLIPGTWQFYTVYIRVAHVFFAFFYTAVTFQPVDVADNLKKQNAFIPQVRPGKATAEYIDFVVTRITVGGAFYMALVCTVPTLLQSSSRAVLLRWHVAHDRRRRRARHVAADRVHLITRHYEGMTAGRPAPLRGRG